jgi:hypothetical protein
VVAGVALLVFVFILPSGLMNGLRDLGQRYIRFVPRPASREQDPTDHPVISIDSPDSLLPPRRSTP